MEKGGVRAAVRVLGGPLFFGGGNPGMIHQAIGIGQVAMATPAHDLPDQLELAQNESREKRDRQTDRRRGKGRRPDEVGGSARRQKF